MKHEIQDVIIPHDKRKEFNEKILHIINLDLETNISKSDIYNVYTGEGGLHGLGYNDFNNFHEYTEAKKEIEQGQFFTPHKLSKFLVECISPTMYDLVADLTCGMGNFFNFLPNEANVYGNELDIKAYKVAKYLYPEVIISCDDIRLYNPDVKFDVIFGNPPFNLKWKVGGNEYLSQLFYCMKSSELLKPGGILALITPDSFLKDTFMDGGMIKKLNEMFNFVCQFDLLPNSFKALGVDFYQTKVVIFQKKSHYLEDVNYNIEKITLPSLDDKGASFIYESYIKGLMEQKEKIKAKLFFENAHSNGTEERDFQYQVQKLLFAIKNHPAVRQYYTKCAEYVNKYYTQTKPEDMKWEEWEKVRATKAKVLSYLKRTVRKQNEKEEDKIQLVKTDFGFKLKGYSRKNKLFLAKYTGDKEASLNHMLAYEEYPFEDQTYRKLFERKLAAFKKQDTKLKDVSVNLEIANYLDNFKLVDYSTWETIVFNQRQKEDLGKILQKNYTAINWQMGSGKTLAGMAWCKFLLGKGKVKNIFVISAAISTNMTWDIKLRDYGENYIVIRSLNDIYQIQPGQVVVISFDMLTKYQRHVKKFVRMQSQKIGLIVDESDELTNHLSQRTRATLSCFRRVRFKLLTTGTTTRNSINELYSQLELLYNNSINMLCKCEYTYNYNKEREIEEENNPYYMQPFPAYYGKSLFKSCFSPHKVTVFGIINLKEMCINKNVHK